MAVTPLHNWVIKVARAAAVYCAIVDESEMAWGNLRTVTCCSLQQGCECRTLPVSAAFRVVISCNKNSYLQLNTDFICGAWSEEKIIHCATA